MIWYLLWMATLIAAYFFGYLGGYQFGVKETEGRWSDAVTKAGFEMTGKGWTLYDRIR